MLAPTYTVNTAPVLRAIALIQRQATHNFLPKILRHAALGVAIKAYRLTDPLRAGWPEQRLQVEVTSYTNAKRTKEATSARAPFISGDRPLADGGRRLSHTPNPEAGKRPFPRTTGYTKVRPNTFGNLTTAYNTNRLVPLAVLIVMARARVNSQYNILTDHRWQIPHNALARLRGKGTARLRQDFIRDAITRMIRQRNSSRNFIRRGWSEAADRVKRIFPAMSGQADAIDIQATILREKSSPLYGTAIAPVSRASTGGGGTASQWLTIENTVGETETGPHLRARRQSALMAHGGPALDAAIAAHAADMRSHYLPKATAELAAEWRKL